MSRTPATSRKRLPNRRPALTFDLEAGGQRYAATIGSYSDGRPAEIFLTASRAGSQADTSARDAAIVARLALQHGASVDAKAAREGLADHSGNGRAGGNHPGGLQCLLTSFV